MGELLVFAEEITYLAAAHTDVAGGHILVGPDVAVKFVHERLAEAHNLSVAAATWGKVGTTLGTAHGECSKSVLECLLEAEELHNGQVD